MRSRNILTMPLLAGGIYILLSLVGIGSKPALAAPQITLYKDSSPSNPTEISPYDGWSRAEASFSFHIEASDFNTYAVYLSTPDGSLHGSIEGNTDTIDSMDSSSKALGAMEANTWGIRYADGDSASSASSAIEDKEYTAPKVVGSGNIVGPTNADILSSKNGNTTDTITRHYAIDVAATADNTLTPDTYTGTIVLSAIATPRVIAAAGTFQDFTVAKCEAIPKNTTTALEDSRDGKVYLVSRLEDGNCWMVQNLALEGNADGTKKTVQAYNYKTGQVYDYEMPASNINFSDNVSLEQMYNGTHEDAALDTTGYAENQSAGEKNCHSNSTGDCRGSNSGSYYSWLTAIAKTNTATLPVQSASTTSYAIMDYSEFYTSICPKGWRLPSGGDSGQLESLYDAYSNNNSNFRSAWRPGSTGNLVFVGLLQDSGRGGNWWSNKSRAETYNAYYMSGTYGFDPNNYNPMFYGYSVRCMFEVPKPTFTMQTMSLSDCGDGSAPVRVQDNRDGKIYLAQRLKDGNCWMVQNLALEGGSRLDSNSSNLNSGQTYTVPTSTQSFSTSGTPQQMFNGSHRDHKSDTAGCWPTGGKTVAEYCTASNKTGSNNNNSGAYYTWDAATAGKYTSSSSGEATQSICPKKWTLPSSNKGNTVDKSFNKLYAGSSGNGYDSVKADFDAVWRPSYGGYVAGGSSLSDSSTRGVWWSSTISNGSNSYNLIEFANGTINPSNSSGFRYSGLSVRCVFAG